MTSRPGLNALFHYFQIRSYLSLMDMKNDTLRSGLALMSQELFPRGVNGADPGVGGKPRLVDSSIEHQLLDLRTAIQDEIRLTNSRPRRP